MILLVLFVACGRDAVQWSDVSYSAPPRPRMIPPGTLTPPGEPCAVSVRAARSGRSVVAAWWTVRPDSSGLLLIARSSDEGRSWTVPTIADSSDHSVRGCARPAPAIAADSASGYVHLAYFAEPSAGHGIFFAHSMDDGRTFHAPVPIVFGDSPGFVAVASEGDRVVVAYDDPNSTQPTVGVALSSTMGHIFRPGQVVSNTSEPAKQPVVALHGDTINVWWWSDHSDDPLSSGARTAYRSGVWR